MQHTPESRMCAIVTDAGMPGLGVARVIAALHYVNMLPHRPGLRCCRRECEPDLQLGNVGDVVRRPNVLDIGGELGLKLGLQNNHAL